MHSPRGARVGQKTMYEDFDKGYCRQFPCGPHLLLARAQTRHNTVIKRWEEEHTSNHTWAASPRQSFGTTRRIRLAEATWAQPLIREELS